MWLFSLENSLQAIAPHLSPLIAPDALERLQAIGRCFPDALTYSYGFEARLHPAEPTVDFAIHITPTERDILAGLHPTIKLPDVFQQHPVWQRIRQFCLEWADPSSELHYQVNDLWLEFDAHQSQNSPDVPVPGLFVSPVPPQGGIVPDYTWIWRKALPLLCDNDMAEGVELNVIQCIHNLPTQVGIFQFGFMFGRKIEAVRFCLSGSPIQMIPHLNQLGWQGSLQEIERLFALLYSYCDGAILDIDVGSLIYPRIGVEGIYISRYLSCVNGQWASLLNHLVEQNLCEPFMRDALLKYAGYTVNKPLHQRIYIRGLSHVKLLYQPGKPLSSKVYFGVMHKPISASPTLSAGLQTRAGTSLANSAAVASPRATVTQSLQAAITFLLTSRDSQGWWTDFHLGAGLSDEWVTGYVGTTLASDSAIAVDPQALDAAQTAWTLLQARRHRITGLWGFNRFPPGDADSTGWVLQLAHALGEPQSERVQQALQSLREHWRSNGGVSTYGSAEAIRSFIYAAPEQSMEGWCGSHICVSAALAALPEVRDQLLDYLHSTQNSEGSWSAYWWHDLEYSTALAAEALAVSDDSSEAIANAVQWALQRLSPTGFIATNDHPLGSPFATAWGLRLLLLGKPEQTEAAIAAVIRWLLTQQQLDGSWESSARLRVPFPDDLDPNQFDRWVYHDKIEGSLNFDQHHVFTTATVLQALFKAKSHLPFNADAESDRPLTAVD
ncbi:hypothetical protein FD723_06735 [Nostoc sp. C052]|uniref:prenyltransferase/squalene oxidase repeat-containing protein n=1 Tax=Nostoc sp. C052 TaxID=2576902 RepID=UPI0015C2DC91|nr:prenyltransferase/squalene oxidase repeat-containing protein [Nostoc sp. C052]QLE40178.1 hypothetical protein FD723_06735 [Nostoc sp. C052]